MLTLPQNERSAVSTSFSSVSQGVYFFYWKTASTLEHSMQVSLSVLILPKLLSALLVTCACSVDLQHLTTAKRRICTLQTAVPWQADAATARFFVLSLWFVMCRVFSWLVLDIWLACKSLVEACTARWTNSASDEKNWDLLLHVQLVKQDRCSPVQTW